MLCNGKAVMTKRIAGAALKNGIKRGTFKDGYGRIYHCPDCNMWHLTHKPESNPFNHVSLKHVKEWSKLIQ